MTGQQRALSSQKEKDMPPGNPMGQTSFTAPAIGTCS